MSFGNISGLFSGLVFFDLNKENQVYAVNRYPVYGQGLIYSKGISYFGPSYMRLDIYAGYTYCNDPEINREVIVSIDDVPAMVYIASNDSESYRFILEDFSYEISPDRRSANYKICGKLKKLVGPWDTTGEITELAERMGSISGNTLDIVSEGPMNLWLL